ncbi:DNA topoisomerase [Scheffersomyces amazonensis]|uniref:DNA topoisomerase n=1 Tax=Scheffersomyces amazonensis TaxID=1078765 RepID=UPI00315CF950
MKILCVAEKPSIAKEVSRILSGGNFRTRNSKNKYIKNYDFKFNFPRKGSCDVTMTSVVGHLTGVDFPPAYKWGNCIAGKLFDAEIVEKVMKQDVFDNIVNEARNSGQLMIWTDCDREGEYIGYEIFKAASKGNNRLAIENIWRSRFSHLERSHIIQAAANPVTLDLKAINAVSCRIELDLRVGASFTRLLTDALKNKSVIDAKDVASYGTCQFPTLGFVVDRYKRVKSFTPEKFWHIQVELAKDGVKTNFNWTKGHFFDRLYVMNLYQECLKHKDGKIIKLEQKRRSNYRPLPLTTVELQKDCSMFFKMSAKAALEAAEKLYNRGFLSYPRTETDTFPATFDFKGTIERQTSDSRWGEYASRLLTNGIENARSGNKNDEAHPPIHPVNYVNINTLTSADEKKVYEYVVRRFLACCSKDAIGQQTSATLLWGDETFTSSGLMVTEKNYLEIYTYKKWESSKQLPKFIQGEVLPITGGIIKEGKTTAPNYMTETELIALMDANGIGTDATIAEHIDKIINRGYVVKEKKKGEIIVPSPLGMGLIEGFDGMDFDNISLSKPFLRKRLETSLQQIVDGTTTKDEVLAELKGLYKQAFSVSNRNINQLVNYCKTVISENS